jgi:hypothetical protein
VDEAWNAKKPMAAITPPSTLSSRLALSTGWYRVMPSTNTATTAITVFSMSVGQSREGECAPTRYSTANECTDEKAELLGTATGVTAIIRIDTCNVIQSSFKRWCGEYQGQWENNSIEEHRAQGGAAAVSMELRKSHNEEERNRRNERSVKALKCITVRNV